MIKELFITGLLSFTVGSTPIKESYNPPKQLDTQFNSFDGGYCFNDSLDYSAFFDYWDDFQELGTVSFSTYDNTFLNIASGYGLITCFNGDLNYRGNLVNSVYLYNDIQYWEFSVRAYSEEFLVSVICHFVNPLQTLTYEFSLFSDGTLDYANDVDFNFFSKSALYFKNRYVSTAEIEYRLYRLLFDKSNGYVENYTGWYSFNGTQTDNYYFSVVGNLTVNNTHYDYMTKNTESINGIWQLTISMMIYNGYGNETYDYLYKSNTFVERSINQCYFTNVLLPSDLKSRMSLSGSFGFIPTVNNYDFGEMIFSIVDSPVYMLRQLFSFELFGVQFYVAFMSIVTLLLICFVVRKLV